MTYEEALKFLLDIPMFQQVGAAAMNPGLEKITELLHELGDPHLRLRTVHVAGTNGKGSVSHLLCSVLMAAGYKTGLYTSPHLYDFRERVRIDGQMVSPAEVAAFVTRIEGAVGRIRPSFFEVTTALAFDCFARRGVDVAVVETGLGGRLDATNVLTPELSVITNIAFDHTDFLGDTLAKIAFEKAGIIKPSVAAVVGETLPETAPVFIQKAREVQAPLTFADRRFACVSASVTGEVQEFRLQSLTDGCLFSLESDLLGFYQQKNILTLLTAAEVLAARGFAVTRRAVGEGVKRCAAVTGLRGRWQVLGRAPYVVCDTGHNENGIAQTVRQIAACRRGTLFMVLGFVRDKDLSRVLPLLPRDARYIFTRPSCARGLPEGELQRQAGAAGLSGVTASGASQALALALSQAGPDDMVYVGGSTYVVADLKTALPEG